MTPPENDILQDLGLNFSVTLAQVSIQLFLYGVFCILFSASAVIFARRGFSNRAKAAMFSATVINFLLFSLNTLTEVVALVVYIREALVLDIDYPFTEKQELVNNMGAFQNVDIVMLYMWSGGIPSLLSDLIVIWRAWALFPDQQWVVLIPIILWIVGGGIWVGDRIWTSIHFAQYASNIDISLSTANFILSIATNAITTMMIMYKLWTHHTFLVKTLGLSGRKSSVQTILMLLIESGLVFLGLRIAYLVFNKDGNPLGFDTFVFQAISITISAMYPTVVMILVETQRSMTDVCEISASNPSQFAGPPMTSGARAAVLGHLAFAVGPVYSTTDDEAESQRSRALQSQAGQVHGSEGDILEVKGESSWH